MPKNLTGLAASGQTQPQIMIGDIWRDKRGAQVTITNAVFNRVSFVRDGYEFPCRYPQERFTKEFSFVSKGVKK